MITIEIIYIMHMRKWYPFKQIQNFRQNIDTHFWQHFNSLVHL
jgi:hypothetical protein